MTKILNRHIDSPAAWMPDDLAEDSSWILDWSPEQLAVIDEALDTVKAQGHETLQFAREDFPIGACAGLIEQLREQMENGRGVVLMRGLPIDRYSNDDIYKIYWGLARHLGEPIYQNAKGELIGEVTNRGLDYKKNNVRGYNTTARLRPHCDAGDMVGLLCTHPAKRGGESYLTSSLTIHNLILRDKPHLLPPLYNGFHFDLRGEGATGRKDEVTYHRVPVFSFYIGQLSCRFNRKTIEDGMRKAKIKLTDLEAEAIAYFEKLALDKDIRYRMKLKRGDIQFLCNHTVMHARSKFTDHDDKKKRRRLLRVWVNLPNARPLDEAFSNRFNTGPRQGIRPQQGAGYWAGA